MPLIPYCTQPRCPFHQQVFRMGMPEGPAITLQIMGAQKSHGSPQAGANIWASSAFSPAGASKKKRMGVWNAAEREERGSNGEGFLECCVLLSALHARVLMSACAAQAWQTLQTRRAAPGSAILGCRTQMSATCCTSRRGRHRSSAKPGPEGDCSAFPHCFVRSSPLCACASWLHASISVMLCRTGMP